MGYCCVLHGNFLGDDVRDPDHGVRRLPPRLGDASTSRSTVFCGGESITLSVGNADSYLWSTGATTKSIQVNTAGSYTVTVNNITPSCQSISTPVVVTVNPAPVSQFQILITTLRTLESIGFSNLSTGSVSWLWDFGDGKTSTDKNPLHDYTTGGSYIVKLAVTSDKGCQVTSSQSIDVITGLDEDLAVIALKSFPNPFHSSFFVSLLAPERQLISIQVVNVLGKPVYQTEGETGHLYEIPGAEFPEGMYILRVHTDTGTFNGKVVKVR